MTDLRLSRSALRFSLALAMLSMGLLSEWRAANAAESESVARARQSVAYEHEHLGVIGTLFCKQRVEWLDARFASFEDDKAEVDFERNELYVKSAIEDVRQCEDSHTVDVEAIAGIVLFVTGGLFLFVRRRRRRVAL